ncbi:helicase-like transcription factor [Acanthaster planci]|uniref:Helicase-like transcription factor n=1 Tax=Acanthaster planci TaxID=133434 RepID=A0A8B7XJI0_ACAPL|nr:helicase-like transcription factor [Acanthaster planci]
MLSSSSYCCSWSSPRSGLCLSGEGQDELKKKLVETLLAVLRQGADEAWNPAAEDQRFDRCHRLRQTKDVVIIKFIVKDSIEERMLELQDKKRKLIARAFSKKLTTEERQQARINDIKTLMDLSGMVPGQSTK